MPNAEKDYREALSYNPDREFLVRRNTHSKREDSGWPELVYQLLVLIGVVGIRPSYPYLVIAAYRDFVTVGMMSIRLKWHFTISKLRFRKDYTHPQES